MNNPWLSVIIPAHNCARTIERLMWSIVYQGDLDIEVIIADDNSTDNFLDIIKEKFTNMLDIKYIKTTPREIHCPGNTRIDGWKYASGEWITFIDHDDEFEPLTFAHVKKWIEERHEKRMVYSLIRGWDPVKKEYTKTYDAITWMHGKFYNRQWLLDNHINFKENLFANEDLYFNTAVQGAMINDGSNSDEYTRAVFYSYKWFEEPDSLSRSMKFGNHSYTETYFGDYITASTEPWFNAALAHPENGSIFLIKTYYNLLHCYFYYQFFLWKKEKTGIEPLEYCYPLIKDLFYRICNTFNVTGEDIINEVYKRDNSDDNYTMIKSAIVNSTDPFIEIQSFRDFIKEME